MQEQRGTRVNKFLSEIGYCSRRKADKLIEEGRVKINGKSTQLGQRILASDTISVDGTKIARFQKEKKYIIFNKPRGIVCTTDNKREKNNIIDYINYPTRIFPIGRLDKLSEGLIFLTNDGDIVNKILRSRNNHEKEYEVIVDKPITKEFVLSMQKGIPILGTITKKCKLKKISSNKFNIILTQGLNRQIRRMCEYLNYKVIKLKRVRIMNIQLDLELGQHREFTISELIEIERLLERSYKTNL